MPYYSPFDEVFFRCPAFPVNECAKPFDSTESDTLAFLDNKLFNLAIYVASPDLHGEAEKWKNDPDHDPKAKIKIINTLKKYWLRMSTRCTPYGLFAGSFIAKLDNETNITLNKSESHMKVSRLDMNLLCELGFHISKIPTVTKHLLFFTNNSLYDISGGYRYIEFILEGLERQYFVREIDSNQYLESVIQLAKNGATLHVLAASLVDEEITLEEAASFIQELCENQIIISELSPSVTGDDYLEILIKKLRPINEVTDICNKLQEVQSLLKSDFNASIQFAKISQIVNSIVPVNNFKDIIQTDLFISPKTSKVNRQVVTNIIHDFENLLPLCTHVKVQRLNKFIERFIERYEDQEVPLYLAIDSETGIGYDGDNESSDIPSLLKGLNFNYTIDNKLIKWDKISEYKLHQVVKANVTNLKEIKLTDYDIDQLRYEDPNSLLIDSGYLHGSLMSKNFNSIDAGEYNFILRTFHGPSAANLLGRFCSGDPDFTSKIRSYLLEEEKNNPDVIFAEIAHIPQKQRLGNVITRPHLRKYEIPYLSLSRLDQKQQIPIIDLTIRIVNNKVVLKSKSLNKIIEPRLSSAHSFWGNNLPIYKFLCDLQTQQCLNTNIWDWGILNNLEFLPRITYNKIIISRAGWNLILANHRNKNWDSKTVETELKSFIEKHKIPNRVLVMEGDHELLVDLNTSFGKNIVANILQELNAVSFIEYFGTLEHYFVTNEGGEKFANEIIIPVKKISPLKVEELKSHNVDLHKRTFVPGSDWFYIKIYCGSVTTDKLICEALEMLTLDLTLKGTIDYWFFIRYSDPHPHIRLRFHGKADFWHSVLTLLKPIMDPFINDRSIYKIQIDTYQRELERYSFVPIELTEKIFFSDSVAVIKLIKKISIHKDEKIRWLIAMKGIEMYLNDFEFSLKEKQSFLTLLKENFMREFKTGKNQKKSLDTSYRKELPYINDFFNDKNENYIEFIEILWERSSKIKELLRAYKVKKDINGQFPEFKDLLSSYIHMFLNRLFRSNQRKMEFVIYYYLSKFMESQIAKEKVKKVIM